MSSRSLQDDLLDIPGVEGAELDGTGGSPAGLRIRIGEGADQRAVGSEIRRVLTKHGLGTDTRLPGEDAASDVDPSPDDPQVDAPRTDAAASETQDIDGRDSSDEHEPTPSQEESAAIEPVNAVLPVAVLTEDPSYHVDDVPERVIDLTDAPGGNDEEDETEGPPEIRPDVDPAPTGVEASPDPGSWAESHKPMGEPATPPSVPSSSTTGAAVASAGQDGFAVMSRIDSVAVEEARDGIVVRVSSTDGRTESRRATSTEGGVETAVVKAACRLAQPGVPDPTIIEIEDRRIKGVDIVMIVLDIDGTVFAGSAIVAAGRSFALGRATWAALSL